MSDLEISPAAFTAFNGGTITNNLAQTGATTFGTGTGAISLNGDTTIASAKALAVTTADKLTVGGIIVPQQLYVSVPLFVTDLSKAVFVAPEAFQVTAVRAVYNVAGGVAAVLGVEKLTGTTAPGSGTALLTGSLDLTTTANTVLSGVLTGTTADLQLAAGNRIGIVLGGVLTGLLGCVVTIGLKRI